MTRSTASLQEPDAAGEWLRSHLGRGAELCADSRAIGLGDGFIAWPGLTNDARAYISQACSRGASAVLFDDAGAPHIDVPVPARGYTDLRENAGAVSSAYYGHPSRTMTVFAVTGTNGKTTCAHWLAAGAAAVGQASAVLGTLGLTRFDGANVAEASSANSTESVLTTPDAVSLQRTLAELARSNISTVAFEASSIGLSQHRLQATDVDVAVFTNLSRDHLDYHANMGEYLRAKQSLFAMDTLDAVVVNADDPASDDMLAASAPMALRYACGFSWPTAGSRIDCMVRIASLEDVDGGLLIHFDGDAGHATVRIPVIGRFNALNAAAVCTAWHAAGVPFGMAAKRLERLQPVAGRMQSIFVPGKPLVVVDYAHTPDALQSVLRALRPIASARRGQLWVLFGCGGDRDAGKRPLMGRIAVDLADRIVLTSDNPRSEDPQVILDQIAGSMDSERLWLIADRRDAIVTALMQSESSDVVLVAGKGHETYQEIHQHRYPFSDWSVCNAVLGTREASQ